MGVMEGISAQFFAPSPQSPADVHSRWYKHRIE